MRDCTLSCLAVFLHGKAVCETLQSCHSTCMPRKLRILVQTFSARTTEETSCLLCILSFIKYLLPDLKACDRLMFLFKRLSFLASYIFISNLQQGPLAWSKQHTSFKAYAQILIIAIFLVSTG